MKYRSVLFVLVSPFAACLVAAHTAKPSSNDDHDTIELVQNGYVSYRHCTANVCAALGDPYEYTIYSAQRLSDAIEMEIQGLGFSLHPKSSLEALPLKCGEGADAGRAAGKSFSTDFITFDDDFLSRVNLSRKKLQLDSDVRIVYQIQLLGCYRIITDGAAEAFGHPEYAKIERPELVMGHNPYQTVVALTIAVQMNKRGTLGRFVTVKDDVQSKRLIDGMIRLIQERIKKIEPQRYPSTSSGEIIN